MADWKRLEAFELRVLRKLRSDEGSYLQEKPESDHHEEEGQLPRTCIKEKWSADTNTRGCDCGRKRKESSKKPIVTPCKEGHED